MASTSMADISAYCYIQEETCTPDDYSGSFGFKVEEQSGGRFYVTFDAYLQSFGILNRNKRMYESDNIMSQISGEYIQDQLRRNCWVGEIDHPAAEYENSQLSINRIANPNMRLSSHYIRRPELIGNKLKASIQTDSSNENGMNFAIKIVDGKIIPSFSARVLGELINKNGQPVVVVKKLITYDWVLFPSHPDALAMINRHMESTELESKYNRIAKPNDGKLLMLSDMAQEVANHSAQAEMICEAFGLSIDAVVGLAANSGAMVIEDNGSVYVQPISDRILRESTKSLISDWING